MPRLATDVLDEIKPRSSLYSPVRPTPKLRPSLIGLNREVPEAATQKLPRGREVAPGIRETGAGEDGIIQPDNVAEVDLMALHEGELVVSEVDVRTAGAEQIKKAVERLTKPKERTQVNSKPRREGNVTGFQEGGLVTNQPQPDEPTPQPNGDGKRDSIFQPADSGESVSDIVGTFYKGGATGKDSYYDIASTALSTKLGTKLSESQQIIRQQEGVEGKRAGILQARLQEAGALSGQELATAGATLELDRLDRQERSVEKLEQFDTDQYNKWLDLYNSAKTAGNVNRADTLFKEGKSKGWVEGPDVDHAEILGPTAFQKNKTILDNKNEADWNTDYNRAIKSRDTGKALDLWKQGKDKGYVSGEPPDFETTMGPTDFQIDEKNGLVNELNAAITSRDDVKASQIYQDLIDKGYYSGTVPDYANILARTDSEQETFDQGATLINDGMANQNASMVASGYKMQGIQVLDDSGNPVDATTEYFQALFDEPDTAALDYWVTTLTQSALYGGWGADDTNYTIDKESGDIKDIDGKVVGNINTLAQQHVDFENELRPKPPRFPGQSDEDYTTILGTNAGLSPGEAGVDDDDDTPELTDKEKQDAATTFDDYKEAGGKFPKAYWKMQQTSGESMDDWTDFYKLHISATGDGLVMDYFNYNKQGGKLDSPDWANWQKNEPTWDESKWNDYLKVEDKVKAAKLSTSDWESISEYIVDPGKLWTTNADLVIKHGSTLNPSAYNDLMDERKDYVVTDRYGYQKLQGMSAGDDLFDMVFKDTPKSFSDITSTETDDWGFNSITFDDLEVGYFSYEGNLFYIPAQTITLYDFKGDDGEVAKVINVKTGETVYLSAKAETSLPTISFAQSAETLFVGEQFVRAKAGKPGVNFIQTKPTNSPKGTRPLT